MGKVVFGSLCHLIGGIYLWFHRNAHMTLVKIAEFNWLPGDIKEIIKNGKGVKLKRGCVATEDG